MAFSFANVASEAAAIGGQSQSGVQAQDGDELKDIQTGQLGFKTINGETKAKLLPTPWNPDSPPIPSAQLLCVASSQGILAAAGPDSLIIASTDEVRKVLSAKEGDNIRDIKPILTIPHDRLTHVTFSADESVLLVSGPSTSGLVAYKVENLRSGNSEPALRVHLNSSLRALVPNPNPQTAHLFAIVSQNGELSLADLSTGQLVTGSNGTTLSDGVACVAWSNRGKQLVAGTVAGTATQLKQNGQTVANIPKSTSVPDDTHMSAVAWLEDDVFFTIYTPNSTSTEEGIPPSEYYIVQRSNKTNFTFHKLPEILPPFGLERLPTHHFITRLRKFDPHITDMVLLAATSATDIGIITKSTEPLSTSENPNDIVVNAFTLTSLEDDTRRAALPLSTDSSLDTSPIGMAIDLSGKDPVINPLPADPEIQETAGPVPNLLVLNNEGLLCSWWVIYSDSVKQKTTFSGFDNLRAVEEVRSAVSPPATADSPQKSTEPSSAFGPQSPQLSSSSALHTTVGSQSGFGTTSTPSAFGAPKLHTPSSGFGSGTSFGTTSKIGEQKSSWTSTGFNTTAKNPSAGSAFGQPGFGQPGFSTTPATNGSSSGLVTAPGFGKTSFGQPATPAFSKTGFGSGSTSTAFGTADNASTGSGFALFAQSGGFGTGSEKKNDTSQSPFSKGNSGGFSSFASSSGFGKASEKQEGTFAKPASSGFGGFGQKTSSTSPFVTSTASSVFAQPTGAGEPEKKAAFGGFGNAAISDTKGGFGSGNPFKLESTFKGDGTAKDDGSAPSQNNAFGIGGGLDSLLSDSKTQTTLARDVEAEMEDDEDQVSDSSNKDEERFDGFSSSQKKPEAGISKNFTTPPATITQSKATPAPPVSSLFGPPQQQTTTPQQAYTGFSFASTTPKETPAAAKTLFGTTPIVNPTPAAVQKQQSIKSFDAIGSSTTNTQRKDDLTSAKTAEAPKIKQEPTSDDEDANLNAIPEAPLPPDPVSKPGYATGDTSTSSTNSKASKKPDEAPLPPDFLPANKSVEKEPDEAELPGDDHDGDDDEFSSDFDDSGEEITQDMSPVEEVDDEQDEDASTEQLQTSPESSYKGGDITSPTGRLFTKVTPEDSSKPARPLFGEVGRSAPVFPPPKTQQSPRSPSPMRQFVTHDSLRSDSRSVSAPIRPISAIEQRKNEYSQSTIAAQAMRAREEESAREEARIKALKLANEKAKAEELQALEDDDDERIQRELALPVQPSETLDEFITYQTGAHVTGSKTDIPAQIERLYQDINSMVCTLGINVRSLSAFMLYQKDQVTNENWPDMLNSDAPMEALNKQWSLSDISRLPQGSMALANKVERTQVRAVTHKLESCQSLLGKDLFDLRTKVTAIRKSVQTRARGMPATAPLSAEQASVQHDLRKASALVQMKLVHIEDALAVMKARLAEIGPQAEAKGFRLSNGPNVQKKPTVEAVTNTIAKMTSMAERKSADIDVLEAQLKKIELSTSVNGPTQVNEYATPLRHRTSRLGTTPGSTTSSTFYTPDSKMESSARSARFLRDGNVSLAMISPDDRERWQSKAQRKKNVAAALKSVLEDKQKRNAESV